MNELKEEEIVIYDINSQNDENDDSFNFNLVYPDSYKKKSKLIKLQSKTSLIKQSNAT
eukprot:Pgem_evm1s17607